MNRLVVAAIAVFAIAIASGQPAPFTAAQAQAGRGVYEQNCAGCHGRNLEGSGDAPALSGGTFMLAWRAKMVSELFGEILQNMPPSSPGSLGEASTLNVAAFILQSSGAAPGQQPLTPGAAMTIGSLVTRPAEAGAGRGRGGRGTAAAPVARGAGASTARGVSVAG